MSQQNALLRLWYIGFFLVPLVSGEHLQLQRYPTEFTGWEVSLGAVVQEDLPSHSELGNSTECLERLENLVNPINITPESIAFLDSAGKPSPGLTTGSFIWIGNYEQCKILRNATSGDYQNCKVTAPISLGGRPLPSPLIWTGCLPKECQKGNLTGVAKYISNWVNSKTSGAITISPKNWKLSCVEEQEFDAGAYAAITVLSLIGFLIVVGTLWYQIDPIVSSLEERNEDDDTVLVNAEVTPYEDGQENKSTVEKYETTNQPDSLLGKLIKCFALQQTFKTLTSTETKPGQVLCLNGIRVLSINWVVLGHTYISALGNVGDPSYEANVFKRRSFMILDNAFPSVDSFFVLSGFLVTYLLLKLLVKKGGLGPLQWATFYIHRYVRLTMPYLVAILIEGFLYRLVVSGPLSQDISGATPNQANKACKEDWYKNILYINNLVPYKPTHTEQCLGQSWYLSNDMQFFIIAPIFVMVIFRRPVIGILVTIGTIACSVLATAIITAHYKLDPTILFGNGDNFWMLYNKPWIRIGPYLVGILGGWFHWCWGDKIREKAKLLPEWKRVVVATPLWLATAALQYGVVFGLYHDQQGVFKMKKASEADSVSYQTLAKLAWSSALTIQILLCQYGLGGFINSILSWKGWMVLSRLTYSVYLLHFGLLTVFVSQMRHTFFLQPDFEFAVFYLGILVMSYLAATVLYVCVEQPVASLENMTYRKEKK